MSSFKNIGLIVCLSVSCAVVGCGDDDKSSGDKDAGQSRADAGSTLADSGLPHMDAALGHVDASTPEGDASTAATDAGGQLSDASLDAAQATTFHLTLSDAQESPVCPKAKSGGTGTAAITVSADDSKIEVEVTYSGLSGPATSGHIHYGLAGASGGYVLMFSSLTSPITQTFTAADYMVANGPATFGAFVTALKAGNNSYVNLHTVDCAGGEIRAQIK